jgi:hypothetical protein
MWSLVWPGNFKVKVFSCEPSNFINQTELGLQWACLVLCWRGPNNMRQASQSLSMEKWNFSSFPAELAEGKIMNPTVQVSAAYSQPNIPWCMQWAWLTHVQPTNQSFTASTESWLASFRLPITLNVCVLHTDLSASTWTMSRTSSGLLCRMKMHSCFFIALCAWRWATWGRIGYLDGDILAHTREPGWRDAIALWLVSCIYPACMRRDVVWLPVWTNVACDKNDK